MKMKLSMVALAAMSAVSVANAAGFVNGGFETGDATGWTQGGGYRGGLTNAALNPSALVPGDGGIRSSVITAGTVDPNVGAALGTTVYSGKYSWRVENTVNGGYASVLTQTVANYTDANIFFAWKAVLEGAHGVNDAATMLITLTDKTDNVVLVSRQYNAASGGSGVDPRFTQDLSGNFYTPQWQIEQLAIGSALQGHTFELSVLAADCQPTGHFGYVYVDGFGAVTPPGNVPEPGSLALAGLALAGAAVARRRTKKA